MKSFEEFWKYCMLEDNLEEASEIERIAKANPYLKDFEVEMLEDLIQRAYTEFSKPL